MKIPTRTNLLLIPATLIAAANTVSAVVLAEYEFNDSYAATTTETGVIASVVTAGSGASAVFSGTSASGISGDKSLAVQNLTTGSESAAVSGNEYIEFTLSADTGYTLNLSNLTVDLQRSNSPGAASDWFVRSSLDSYASTIGTNSSAIPVFSDPFANFEIDLSGAAFQGLTSDVTFRLYGYGGANTNSSLRHDNLVINGSAVIPEPASAATLLVGAAAFVAIFARGKRA